MYVSLYWPLSELCVIVCVVCVISNQITSRILYYVPDLSKLDTLLHNAHSKILLVLTCQRLDMYRSVISIKQKHQMWRSPIEPKKLKKNSRERESSGVEDQRRKDEGGWLHKIYKQDVVGNIGGIHKTGGLRSLSQPCIFQTGRFPLQKLCNYINYIINCKAFSFDQ